MALREGRTVLELRVPLPTSPYSVALACLTAAQAAWLGFLASQGWFYGDDLSYMSEANHVPLNWSYLRSPLNDHFAPGVRLTFWLIRHTTALNYDLTILARVVLQAAATLLLYRLLVLLVGCRPGVLLVVGWYAFSPLLMPGFVWLTTSVHLLISQLFVIGALLQHVRYTMTGRVANALACAACVVAAAAFWELTATTALLLPILSLGFLHSGPVTGRLRATLRRWPGWVALSAMLGGWALIFALGPYGGSAHPVGAGQTLHLLKVAWVDSAGPALIGGPWHWFAANDVYFPVSDPATVGVLLGQLAFLVAVVAGWLRLGSRSLLAWSMPALTLVITTVAISVGRAWMFGDLSPRSFNYAFSLAVPFAVALALAFVKCSPEEIAARVDVAAGNSERAFSRRPAGLPRVLPVLGLVIVSSMVSAGTFSARWSKNPSEKYVTSLEASVRSRGPDVNLWDTRVPASVLAAVGSGNHISDVLDLAGARARFQRPESDPLVADDHGNIGPAFFVEAARGVQAPHTLCTALLQGIGTASIRLSKPLEWNDWYVKISYLQQRPTIVHLTVDNADGAVFAPAGGSKVVLDGQLANTYLRLPAGQPKSLVLRSDSIDTNLCIGAVVVGFPLPTGAK